MRRQSLVPSRHGDAGHDSLFPGKVPQQTQDRQDQCHQPEDRTGKESRQGALVFGGKIQLRGHGGVGREEGHPDQHTAWDGQDGVFGPDVGHQCGFAQDRPEHRRVQGRSPHPMPRHLTVRLGKIISPDELRAKVQDQRMIESV